MVENNLGNCLQREGTMIVEEPPVDEIVILGHEIPCQQ